MKKITSILLALTMIFAMGGCSSKTSSMDASENTTPVEKTSDTQGTEVASDGEIYNMVMQIVNYGYDDKDIKLVEDEINKITEPQIGVNVKLLTVPIANMATKLELMVAGGEQMDLVQTGLLTSPNKLAAKGLLTPMTNYLSDNLKSLAGDLLKACTVNGEVYAYPGNLYPAHEVSLLYDKDLADQYKIQIPDRLTSIEDLEQIFEQIKSSGMSQYAISTGDGVNTEWVFGAEYENMGDSVYNAYGVVMGSDTSDTVVNWYETDTYKQQSDTKRSWYNKGYTLPDSISNGYTVTDSLSQGTVFSFLTTLGTGSSAAYWGAQTGKNLASVAISDPAITASGAIQLSFGIASTCKNPQKVCDFLDLLYTDTDLANLMSFGIEGTHYKTQEGSSIIQYPDGVDSSAVGYGSFIGPFGDTSKIYYREPMTDEFVSRVADYGVDKARVSKYMGYAFDTSKVQVELAAVQTVIVQYAPALACGVVDVDATLSEFKEALKAAGVDKVIEENQSQLNAWLKTQ